MESNQPYLESNPSYQPTNDDMNEPTSGLVRRQSPSLNSRSPERRSIRPSTYRDSIKSEPIERRLSHEESYVLKDMKSENSSYLKYLWAYLAFLFIVAAYSIFMIVQWVVTLSLTNTENERCSDLSNTNKKFIIFHSIHIGIYLWGLFSSLTKIPRGLIAFLILNVSMIIWRFSLYYIYFDSPESIIQDCYSKQRFNTQEKELHYLLLGETITEILGIFFGVQLYKKIWNVSKNKNRLSRLTANSIIYKPEQSLKVH